MRRHRIALLLVAVVMVACSTRPPHQLREATLFLPDGAARGPLVVLVPGGGWLTADPGGLEPLARGLARSGYVAATITYRAAADGAHFPVPPADVLCGAASAAAQAAAAGRARGLLVLVGHSAGGQLAVLVALRPDGFRSPCADPPATPDGVVALAGAFDLTGIAQDLFGVSEQERPDLWREGDVHAWVRERPRLPVLLVHGGADLVVPSSASTHLAAALRSAGHPVRTELLPSATHSSVYRPETVLTVLLDWLSRFGAEPVPR